MRVTVDHKECFGSSDCAVVCPQVFKIGPDGLAYVIMDPVPEEERSQVEAAIKACPIDCIHIHADDAEIGPHLLKSIDPGMAEQQTPEHFKQVWSDSARALLEKSEDREGGNA